MTVIIPGKSLLPDPAVVSEVGGDTLHVEAVLVYQLKSLLFIMTLLHFPHTCQVLQDRLGRQIVFVLLLSFLRSLYIFKDD